MNIFMRAMFGAGLAGACAATASANDSVAEVGIGGLVLARTQDIQMVREDLYISIEEIKVDYVFRNRTDKDLESVVAFPLPDIYFDPEANSSLRYDAPDNFLDFKISIDGEPVTPEIDQHAFSMNVEVSDLLKQHGVPLYGHAAGLQAALDKLPEDVLRDFVDRNMVTTDSYIDTKENKEKVNIRANWTLRSAYWWKAKFPAGKEIKVSHRYKPAVGGSSSLSFFSEGKFTDWSREMRESYCVDGSIEAALKKSMNADGYAPFYEQGVEYVLKSGGNWYSGQIGEFHLTVDKGDTKNLLSFCGDGVTKTGPTTFEMTAKDFFPEKDLKFLFLVPTQN